MSSSESAPAGTSLTAVHPDIVQYQILNRLDGATLASTSCASVHFQSLCNEDRLWQRICNSTWPSTAHPRVRSAVSAFPSAHRSFYSDSFPNSLHKCRDETCSSETSELISAVDMYYDNKPVYSKVMRTETISSWFMSSPFRLELLNPKETIPTPLKSRTDGTCKERAQEFLRVSWILIDPANKRAVNVASQKAVEARLHWLNEDLQLRYATVASDCRGNLVQCAVVVKCGGKDGGELEVKEVGMQVEDMEGKILGGMESLVILRGAMNGERERTDVDMEREMYDMFRRNKEELRERKQRRERGLDMVFIATGLSIFFAILLFSLCRCR
ncbi:F-box protein At2g27310-like [Primulina tabacum]|uniref:F-box protein At2g27310-like n=1 Tax=Primulina tabacum TaxID=48773 RepID=UPI003F59D1C6